MISMISNVQYVYVPDSLVFRILDITSWQEPILPQREAILWFFHSNDRIPNLLMVSFEQKFVELYFHFINPIVNQSRYVQT